MMGKTTGVRRVVVGWLTGLALALAAPALAAHAQGLELDGNITSDGGVDWANLFDANYPGVPTPKGTLPPGFSTASFVRDFAQGATGPDASTFTQGSKDTLDVPKWVCASSNNPGDKVDIVNIYAAAYTSASGDAFLYFAMERYANEGDANLAFWFLQNGSVACASPASFQGAHVDGDVLIVSEVTGGGDIASIKVYEWQGTALNTTPVVFGAECSGSGDVVCGAVNQVALHGSGPGKDVPWLTETKASGATPSNELAFAQFFEAGLDLTRAGLAGCFTNVLGDTRQAPGPGKTTSTSLTASLADYALGAFNLCSLSVTKSCSCGAVVDDPSSSDPTKVLFEQLTEATITNSGAVELPGGTVTCTDAFTTPGKPASLTFTLPAALPPKGSMKLSDYFSVAARTMRTAQNPPTNGISCQANVGGATFGDTDQQVCSTCQPDKGLVIDKSCYAKLETVSGLTAVRVWFDGRVCNTGSLPAVASIQETHVGGQQSFPYVTLDAGVRCDADAQCPSSAAQCIGGDPATVKKDGVCYGGGHEGLFFGGDVCALVSGDYLPSSADGGETCAGEAMFSDDLKATLSYDPGTGLSGTKTATCPLVPPDAICTQ